MTGKQRLEVRLPQQLRLVHHLVKKSLQAHTEALVLFVVARLAGQSFWRNTNGKRRQNLIMCYRVHRVEAELALLESDEGEAAGVFLVVALRFHVVRQPLIEEERIETSVRMFALHDLLGVRNSVLSRFVRRKEINYFQIHFSFKISI